jgi:hypothetical protein
MWNTTAVRDGAVEAGVGGPGRAWELAGAVAAWPPGEPAWLPDVGVTATSE